MLIKNSGYRKWRIQLIIRYSYRMTDRIRANVLVQREKFGHISQDDLFSALEMHRDENQLNSLHANVNIVPGILGSFDWTNRHLCCKCLCQSSTEGKFKICWDFSSTHYHTAARFLIMKHSIRFARKRRHFAQKY